MAERGIVLLSSMRSECADVALAKWASLDTALMERSATHGACCNDHIATGRVVSVNGDDGSPMSCHGYCSGDVAVGARA